MSEEPEAEGRDAPIADAEAILAASERRLREIEREAKRVSRQDWDTLFRQMQTLLIALAEQPFLRGDAEAEARLADMLMSDDLEEFDRRADHLAAYVYGKLAFNLALRGGEAAEGDAAAHAAHAANSLAGTRSGARRLLREGPSGDDYKAPEDSAETPQPRRQRSRIRL